ncbi:hypothetical protein A2W24_04830 [Microgenomates group bacterium RBG_16_45_19]|nr:MAG: hypothetical protein A2W24_04830 [Microgenomates group bacterium RBG_16_45_19]
MPRDYVRRPNHSRLYRSEKRRAIRTTLIFTIALVIFMGLFGLLGINLLARLSLLLTHWRTPRPSQLNQDTIPPSAPQLILPYEATTSASITIRGFAEPDSQVALYHNGSHLASTPADPAGDFAFISVNLSDGLNTFSALATDTANNSSARSASLTVIKDIQAPSLNLLSPLDQTHYAGNQERLIPLNGTTEPETSLAVNGQVIVVLSDGTFASQYQLNDGPNQLAFTATDPAGNQTQKTLTVFYSP